MKIPHSPNLFFIFAYTVLTTGGLELNSVIFVEFGKSIGSFLNVMCLCVAIHFALHLPRSNMFKTEWKEPTPFIKYLSSKRVSLAATFGALAAAGDIISFALVNEHFNGATLIDAPKRYLFIGLVYGIIGYVFIGAELRQRWKNRPRTETTDDMLASLIEDMTSADRSAIRSALQNESGTINASQNSCLDIFLKRLSRLGLAQLLEGDHLSEINTIGSDLNLWKISDNGLKTIRSVGNLG